MKKSNMAKNVIMLSMGTVLTKGINLFMIPLFSAWLSTEDYGLFDLFCTYIALMIPFITLASSEAIFRFVVECDNKNEKKRYITAGFMLNFINAVIVCIVLLLIHEFMGWKYIIPFILLLISELFVNHLQGFMRATKQLKLYSLSGIVFTVGNVICVTFFVFKHQMGLQGIILGYAVSYFFGGVLLSFLTHYWDYLDFRCFRLRVIKEMISYSYPLIPNSISWWIINASDRVLINFFIGAVGNGIYAIAYKIPSFISFISESFRISWEERAIDLVHSEEKNNYYTKVFNDVIVTMISLCGGLLSLNYFVFHYVFDMRYYEARLYNPILLTSVIFTSVVQYFGGIQISLKHTEANCVTTIVGAIVNIIVNISLIEVVGLYAAAYSTMISYISICIIRYFKLKNDICLKINKKTYVYIIYYLYLFAMSYMCDSIILSSINVLLACIIFIIANHEFLINSLLEIKKMITGNNCVDSIN